VKSSTDIGESALRSSSAEENNGARCGDSVSWAIDARIRLDHPGFSSGGFEQRRGIFTEISTLSSSFCLKPILLVWPVRSS
jgi:hypothetical protein